MNRITLTIALAGALSASGVHAQNSVSASVAQPSTPAPTIVTAPTGPAVVQAPDAASVQANVTQTVYTPQLPNPADLTNSAAAQGYTVERIVQTSTQVIAFYRNANGQPVTVAYQSLPPTGTSAAPVPMVAQAPGPRVVMTSPPSPAVVYETAPDVVYYRDYPRYYYPPVSFGFGFGYRSYYGGGHFHRHR